MGAVKPFKGEVANSVPSWYKPSKNDNLPPYLNLFILYKKIILLILFYKKRNGNLQLQYAMGCRNFETINTVKFIQQSQSIAYITAALGVVMNI